MRKGGGYVICQQSASAVFKDPRLQKIQCHQKSLASIGSRVVGNLVADFTAVLPPSNGIYSSIDISTYNAISRLCSHAVLMKPTPNTYCKHDEMHRLLLTEALTYTRSALSPNKRLAAIIAWNSRQVSLFPRSQILPSHVVTSLIAIAHLSVCKSTTCSLQAAAEQTSADYGPHVQLIITGMSILFNSNLPFKLHTLAFPFVPFLFFLFPFPIYLLQTTKHPPLFLTPFLQSSSLYIHYKHRLLPKGLNPSCATEDAAVRQRQARASSNLSASTSSERLVLSVNHLDGVDTEAVHARPSAVATTARLTVACFANVQRQPRTQHREASSCVQFVETRLSTE